MFKQLLKNILPLVPSVKSFLVVVVVGFWCLETGFLYVARTVLELSVDQSSLKLRPKTAWVLGLKMCAIILSYPINLSSTDFETVVHDF